MRVKQKARDWRKGYKSGFTIVELLIVIVVIGILAVITVVAYNGITQSAKKASLDSFLNGATKKVEQYTTENGTQPISLPQAGVQLGSGMTGSVRYSPSGYCLQVTSSGQTRNYYTGRAASSDGTCGAIGVVSTLAGSVQGFQDGPIVSALFNNPTGVAVGTDGDIYITDAGNHRIRKISNGIVSTIAGNGVNSSVDGSAGVARVSSPRNPVAGQDGTVYFLESGKLRKVMSSGAVQTVTSTTSGALAQITYDGNGGVYLFDTNLQRVSSAGAVTTIAAQAGYYYAANGLASDGAGGFFVEAEHTDGWAGVLKVNASSVERIVNDGSVVYGAAAIGNTVYSISTTNGERVIKSGAITLAGAAAGFADGTGTIARFSGYGAGSLAASQGTLYLADSSNHRIRSIR